MAEERRFHGRSASPGCAVGRTVVLAIPENRTATARGSAAAEEAALRAALAAAGGELEALAAADAGDGAAILAFQIELLSDPALLDEALSLIKAGEPALLAWRRGLAPQIAEFEDAEDDYFRARAADLLDLEDRVARRLAGIEPAPTALPENAILVDRDLTPSRFLELDWSTLGGAALLEGSASSHVAILARARGVPLLVELGEAIPNGVEAVLDATDGVLIANPEATTREHYRQAAAADARCQAAALERRIEITRTADGVRIELSINVDDPAVLDPTLLAAADGVGLLRTEFLFLGQDRLPDEEVQRGVYCRLLEDLGGKPLTVRTLDIGGDKPLPGLSLEAEANPFLGLRGIRLCLERPALFRPQIRALLRAAVRGPLQVMLPMIAVQAEIDETRKLFETCQAELEAEGIEAALPPLGIMVEIPAAAIAIETLTADFYSIGSNDLIQYVMAAARDAGGRVGALNDPAHPAVLRLIEQVARHGAESEKAVSLCGDMAADPAMVPVLLRAGLRKLSVAPAAFDRVKGAIHETDLGHG